MKFNVASGSVLESLWHDPGRGSGTWKLQVISKINAYLCNVPKEFSTLQAQLILHLPVRYWRVTNSNLDHFALWNYLQRCQQCPVKGINWNISHENRIIYCLTESKYRIYGKHSSAFSFIWHRQNTIFVWKIKQITETHRCQILAVTLYFLTANKRCLIDSNVIRSGVKWEVERPHIVFAYKSWSWLLMNLCRPQVMSA